MPHADVQTREDLELARAEEAEALRRALHLRAISASLDEVREAMQQVDEQRARVSRLQRELQARRLH